jgi:5-methylcytosine-specific restriction endonuclease McrA
MLYSEEDVNWVYDRTHPHGRCFYCCKQLSFANYGIVGAKGAWEIDHFIPLAAGGEDTRRNWVPACVSCNTEKSDFLPWEYMSDRFAKDDRNTGHYLYDCDPSPFLQWLARLFL